MRKCLSSQKKTVKEKQDGSFYSSDHYLEISKTTPSSTARVSGAAKIS